VELAKNVFMIDEFLAMEIDKGNITASQFTSVKRRVILHGHCQQKAHRVCVANSEDPFTSRNLFRPDYCLRLLWHGRDRLVTRKNTMICPMKIGELVLFPRRAAGRDHNHHCCTRERRGRHQIFDGTERKALHPVEILHDALNK
jgi:hypothetical protein